MDRGLLYYLNGTIQDAPQLIIPEPSINSNSFWKPKSEAKSFIKFTKSEIDSSAIGV
jgi:hypothetical protein